MATSPKPVQTARAGNDTLTALRRAFVFNMQLTSRPDQAQPTNFLVSRVLEFARPNAGSDLLQRRVLGNLGLGVGSRYNRFNTELGPLNRIVKFKRRPAQPGFNEADSFEPASDFDYAEAAPTLPLAREFAPVQPRSNQFDSQETATDFASISESPTAPSFSTRRETAPTRLEETWATQPLASQVASFEPVVLRNLATTSRLQAEPTTNRNDMPQVNSSFEFSRPDGAETPTQPIDLTPLQRTLARLDAAEAASERSATSADLHRPTALDLNYFQPGRNSLKNQENGATTEPAQPFTFVTSPASIERAYLEAGLALPTTPQVAQSVAVPTAQLASAQEARNSEPGRVAPPTETSLPGIYRQAETAPTTPVMGVTSGPSLRTEVQRTSLSSSVSARPTVNEWSRSLASLQANPALMQERWTDEAGARGETQFAEPSLGLNWHAPGRQVARTADPVALANTPPTALDFSPALQRSLATLTAPTDGLPQVVLPASQPAPTDQREPKLPGTGLIDRSMSETLAQPTQTDFEPINRASATALARAMERTDQPDEAESGLNWLTEAATGLPLTYAVPGRSRNNGDEYAAQPTPERSNDPVNNPVPTSQSGTESSSFNTSSATVARAAQLENPTIARLYEPARAAQEVSTRLQQTWAGPTNLAALAGMPGFEAVAATNPAGQSLAGSWNNRLSALQSNPGLVARTLASENESEESGAGWQAVSSELALAGPGRRRVAAIGTADNLNDTASELTSNANTVSELSLTTPERAILRTLAELGHDREVSQRLMALTDRLGNPETGRSGATSVFDRGMVAGQLGENRNGAIQRFFDPTSEMTSGAGKGLNRLAERGQASEGDYGTSDFNYVSPPLTLRKSAATAPGGTNSEGATGGMPEALVLANFLSNLGIKADPEALGATQAADNGAAVQRTTEGYQPGTTDNRSALTLNYANPVSAPRQTPTENPFAFNPGVLAGLNLVSQTRRAEAGQVAPSPLALVQRRPVAAANDNQTESAGRFLAGPSDLFEDGASASLATHFDTPFDQPIGVIGQPQLPMLQRKASGQTPAPAARAFDKVLRTSVGQSLDRTVQRRLEPVFGASFDHVRVHTGNTAADYTSQMGAEAFTVGPNIFFAPGRYQPDSVSGQALIGHELTHVVQQANFALAGWRTHTGNVEPGSGDGTRSPEQRTSAAAPPERQPARRYTRQWRNPAEPGRNKF